MGAPTWQNVFEVENLFGWDNLLVTPSEAIQSQYAASPHITALASSFQKQIDASEQIDLIYKNLINLKTATGTALDTWGRILGMPRYLNGEEAQVCWDDDFYRLLLEYKALANISSADADTQNKLLTELFEQGFFIVDNQDMTIRIVFEFTPTAEQKAILQAYGLLTRGAGVGWEYYEIDPNEIFGFDGSGMQPFDQAPFNPYSVVSYTGSDN